MKIEKVSRNKIKVTVSTLDMLKWGVSLENFSQDTPETRELFWTLIKRAEMETGFSFEDSRLVVEAMPHKYDGIILIVTRIDDDYFEPSPYSKKSKIRARAVQLKAPNRIFAFSDFDELCAYVKNTEPAAVKSDLYFYGGKYYLVINGSDSVDAKILEYGKMLSGNDLSVSFLEEYGEPVAKGDAFETIEKHFR